MERIVSGVATRLHHVGIVCADTRVLDSLLYLAGATGERDAKREVSFRHVPEFQCDCYLLGQLELVVPNGPQKEGTPLDQWLRGRGTSLHHIAFEVDDLDAQCVRLRDEGVPVVLDEPVDGVADLRVNFIHPSFCGFLVELVERA